MTSGVGCITSLLFFSLVGEPSRPFVREAKTAPDFVKTDENIIDLGAAFADFDASIMYESYLKPGHVEEGDASPRPKRIKPPHKVLVWSDWFKKPTFWRVTFLYVVIRAYLMLTQTYSQFYVKYTLKMEEVSHILWLSYNS